MKPEVLLVHDETSDEPDESRSIYNPLKNEVFTYHYDRQKGVGKKYNLTHGLIRCTDKIVVKENK